MSASAGKDGLQQTDMESSTYSQVVFIDVPPSYPLHTDVTCWYKLTGGLTASSKDWIGVYKVGWDSLQKYCYYEYVKPCLDHKALDPLTQHIVLRERYLPKDDGEFYQFCYVDSNGQVRGASTPFCFQNPAESSIDCSLLVISTQEQVEQMEKEKQTLQTQMEQTKEEKSILKNELDERLLEICRLRVELDEARKMISKQAEMTEVSRLEREHLSEENKKLQDDVERLQMQIYEHSSGANASSAQPPQNPLRPIAPSPVNTQQQPLSDSFYCEEQESLTPSSEKYMRAIQKINLLKQDKLQLQQQVKEKDAEIAELRSRAKNTEQDYNRLQDHFQLLQVDMQSIQKEKERLYAEKEQNKLDLVRLQEENRSLYATLSNHMSPDGDKSDTKVLTLTNELAEIRGALRKEFLNSKEANKRAEKAELEAKELKALLEKSTVNETELDEARKTIGKQAEMAEVSRLEKDKLSEENKKLKDDVERLQMMIYELSAGANASSAQPPQSPLSPVATSPVNTQQQPLSDPFYYGDVGGPLGNPTDAGSKAKVCSHCRESFPDITEEELAIHEQSHKVCPFCTLICDDFGQQEFEDHVYSHEE